MPGYQLGGSADAAQRGAKAAAIKTKVCKWCGMRKPASQFYRDYTTKDRLGTQCRPCNTAYKRAGGAEARKDARRVEYELALRYLSPSPAELRAWTRAAARSGLSDPTPDDVLSEFYGVDDWAGFRPGVGFVVTVMAERSA